MVKQSVRILQNDLATETLPLTQTEHVKAPENCNIEDSTLSPATSDCDLSPLP